MLWWLWVLLGIALLFVELATPGSFFPFFFGVSAIAVGALAAFGIAGPPWMQWLLFSLLSVVALGLLRRPLSARLASRGNRKPVDSMLGESGVVMEDIGAQAPGKVELRGSSWNARSTTGAGLTKGQRCVVERVEGLTLWVRPE
jgi:membrane protein implicated in regulation of membrane protease activity